MQDIHGIRPPILVGMDPLIIKIILMVLAGVLLCVILFFLIKKWIQKGQSPDSLKTLPNILPPYETAMKALDRLGIESMNDPRAFYFYLTLILRKYMSGTFNINPESCRATEMTSEEFLRHIKLLDMDKMIKENISQFQHYSDPIKYAGIRPEKDAVQKDIEIVKNIIKQIQTGLVKPDEKQEENP
ncbi:MAG: hypothetical protein ABIJ59_20165 [Pseudomonadota bacterium]